MSISLIRKSLLALLLAAGGAALSAAPQIKVDNMTFSGGRVNENGKVEAVFTFTNTGTSPLRITSVRPGCGCTVVAYDTVIAPGKTGLLKPVVDLKGMRPGHMSRGVSVTTNAPNNQTLNLTIEATIVPFIEVSESYLVFANAQSNTVTLTSAKQDLMVDRVTFEPQGGGGNAPNWVANAAITLKYALTPSDTVREDGLKAYELEINSPASAGESMSGVFRISTNHPDRREITINGRAQ